MKQVAQNYRSGELAVLDVPVPACKPGGVLVRSLFSLVSTGTETMKVNEARLSLAGKARARPDQVRKVLDSVAQNGTVSTYKKVMTRLDSFTPLGYSLCGVVEEVGEGVPELRVGQLVACAGNEYALHAEVNWVPTNLCVPLPAGVRPEHGAFATVGAIAMHGVRRAEVQLGDTACVVGLGLVGQLVVRLLSAAGVVVVGLDVVEDRCRAAEKAGAVLCAAPTDEGLGAAEQALLQASGGLGADHVFLVAGGSSAGPVQAAARLARDRARVVDIGKCSLDLPWNAYYDKELELRLSRSYGPGRYDETYEVQGVDYPAGYVRWTERRNLACFLDLLAREEVDVAPLVSEVFPIEQATDVYERLGAGSLHGVGFLFEYPRQDLGQAPAVMPPAAVVPAQRVRRPDGGAVRVGFVGAGSYASSMLLPHLAREDSVRLVRVATTRSLSAFNAQRRFGFDAAATDVDAVLDDESIDAVFVVTRHHLHAELVCQALERGKTVFVEKPLALTGEQLDRVLDVVASTGNDRLMVGFNRRFAPLLTDLRARFGSPRGATSVRYLVNAGPLDATSWYRNEELEGSRFVGEGGHFLDTVSWWVGSLPTEVFAVAAGSGHQDVQATVRFQDGSTAVISYLTTGNPRFPKETLDVAAGGRSARMDNFRQTSVWSGRQRTTRRAHGGQDKGQRGQLEGFVRAVRTGAPLPIPLGSLVATTRATLAVQASLHSGRPEEVRVGVTAPPLPG